LKTSDILQKIKASVQFYRIETPKGSCEKVLNYLNALFIFLLHVQCTVFWPVCFSFCSFHIDLRDVYMIINDEKFADRFLAYTHCGKYILESMMSVAGKIFLLEVSDQNIWRMENIFMFFVEWTSL